MYNKKHKPMSHTQKDQEYILAKYSLWFNISFKSSGSIHGLPVFWIHGCSNSKHMSSLQSHLTLQNQEQKTLLPSTQAEKCPFLVCSLPREANVSVQLQGNCPSTSSLKKKPKKTREQEPHMHQLQTQSFVFSTLHAYPRMCSSAIMQFTMSYLITVWTDKHAFTCASPKRTELVEVLWLSFCSGEPQTCLKECPSWA